MATGSWSHFQHLADIGVCGTGMTLEAAFANAAVALTAVVTDPNVVRAEQPVRVSCSAPDSELLLVDFLNAVIYEMATRHMLFSRFDVTLDGNRLTATIWGEAIDRERHDPAVEVKGASYTALQVGRNGEHWYAQCVVDV